MPTQPDLRRYLNIRSSMGGSLRHDGRRLAFLNDTTGVLQVWTVDGPGLWPEQRTFYPDRITFVSYSPASHALIFGKDEGGNEQDQFYLMDDEGLDIRPLTAMPSARHMWGAWSHDGQRIAFTATRDNPAEFYPYVMDLARGEIELVTELPGYNVVTKWMPNDDALIIIRFTSNANSDLFFLDLATGEARHLTPHEGDVLYQAAEPLPDGSGLLILTDEGRDFLNLAVYDLATGEVHSLGEYNWDQEELALTPDGRWLGVLSNEDGYGVLEIRDRLHETHTTIEGLPHGVLAGLTAGRDGKTFLLTATSSTEALNVWAVDAERGTVTRWTASSLATLPPEALVEPELVRYPSFDGLTIPAFYFKPRAATGAFPVVIDIHGGPEAQRRPLFSPVTQYLVSQGYAVLAPNVRGSAGYGKSYMHLDDVYRRMDSVADIKAAYEWLIREGGAAPDKVAVYGGSYGGFMVLSALTTYPELWAAGVDIVGIANFVTFLENTSAYRRKVREAEYGSLERDRDFLQSISPLTHVDRITAPLVVIHGANDPRVPVGEAEQVVAALQERQVPVEYLCYPDEGHGFAKLENRLDAYPKVVAFLDHYVKRPG
ncbi:MAG: S9 family peptidase [Ardenticatenaceae bacterium]|nr:S9 family peptidase [Ardenticatenaceae bacterium]